MLRYHESIDIAAPADAIYDLVADVTSTGDRSPECRRFEWLDEPAKAVVGAPFSRAQPMARLQTVAHLYHRPSRPRTRVRLQD